MKQLNLDYTLKIVNDKTFIIVLKAILRAKFNLLTGDSATLKTFLVSTITLNYNKPNMEYYVLDYNKNKIHIVANMEELLNINLNSYDLCICDEGLSNDITDTLMAKHATPKRKILANNLFNAKTKFMFICRDMPALPVAYYSIFELERQFDRNILKPLFAKEYKKFNNCNRIVIEDSTTGFEYYKHHFKNVISSYGNAKLVKVCNKDDTVVADGAAIGLVLKKLLSITQNIYLPESFEYDLATHWLPRHKLVTNYLEDMPDVCASVEQYFEHVVLPTLCSENHIPQYSKSRKLHPVLLSIKIHDDCKALFEKFAIDHGLTFDEAYKQYSILYDTDDLTEIINHLKEDGLI